MAAALARRLRLTLALIPAALAATLVQNLLARSAVHRPAGARSHYPSATTPTRAGCRCRGRWPGAPSSERCGSCTRPGSASTTRTLVHPELGVTAVDCRALFTENQAQVLLVLNGAPGAEAARTLQLLSVIGEEDFSRAR